MAEYLGDADDGEIFGVDDGVATRAAHAVSAHAEELERWLPAPQSFDKLRAVHFAGGLPGRDQDSHVQHFTGGTAYRAGITGSPRWKTQRTPFQRSPPMTSSRLAIQM